MQGSKSEWQILLYQRRITKLRDLSLCACILTLVTEVSEIYTANFSESRTSYRNTSSHRLQDGKHSEIHTFLYSSPHHRQDIFSRCTLALHHVLQPFTGHAFISTSFPRNLFSRQKEEAPLNITSLRHLLLTPVDVCSTKRKQAGEVKVRVTTPFE